MKQQKIIILILSIVIVSFFLNFIWEVSHSFLYDWNSLPLENDVYFYILKIFIATFGDVMYTILIFFIISIFKKDISWIYSSKKSDYSFLIILGLFFAIFVEIKAKLFNLWSYNQYMPQILGIGLTPLIQPAATSALTIFILNKFIFRAKTKGDRKWREIESEESVYWY